MVSGIAHFLLYAFCFMLSIVSQVEIIAEREGPKRWEFDMQTLDDAGGLRRVTMSLTWADYNLWSSDGSDAPAKVAEAALLFLMKRGAPDGIPSKFDASFARRKFPDADEVIPKLIRR